MTSVKIRNIRFFKYPDDFVLQSIVQRHGEIADKVLSGLTNVISGAHYRSDYFCAILYNESGEVIIGCANFFQSSTEPSEWLYSDIWITPECQRQGFAADLIRAGLRYLSDLNAKTLLCTVEPQNETSIRLQKSLGFQPVETRPFEDFELDGLFMFELRVPTNFNVIPLANDYNQLDFICELRTRTEIVAAMHWKPIPQAEFRSFFRDMKAKLIEYPSPNQRNYIIRKGIVPVAWLRISTMRENGLTIDTLVVHERFRNLGAGRFALDFAEDFARSARYGWIEIPVADDNQAARTFLQKAGYAAGNEESCPNGDESGFVRRMFRKEIAIS